MMKIGIVLFIVAWVVLWILIPMFKKSPYPIHITDPGGEVVERYPTRGLVRGLDTSPWEAGTVLVLGDSSALRAATPEELEMIDSGYITKFGTVREIRKQN